MEDIDKIKPYIVHLSRQLRQLRTEIGKFTTKSLDEQLLIESDERKKLDLSNRYAYVLSSLCFINMKINNVKDISPVMTELGRCKSYMDQAKQLDAKKNAETQDLERQEKQAKKVINSALDGRNVKPAISKANFQGKHTKFQAEESSSPDSRLGEEVIGQLKKNKGIITKQKVTSGKISKRKN